VKGTVHGIEDVLRMQRDRTVPQHARQPVRPVQRERNGDHLMGTPCPRCTVNPADWQAGAHRYALTHGTTPPKAPPPSPGPGVDPLNDYFTGHQQRCVMCQGSGSL
jgi:hypothetical protein